MISAATIAGLEQRRLEYILGARERSDAIAKAVVLKNKDPFVPLLIERKRGETQLFAKEVTVEGWWACPMQKTGHIHQQSPPAATINGARRPRKAQ